MRHVAFNPDDLSSSDSYGDGIPAQSSKQWWSDWVSKAGEETRLLVQSVRLEQGAKLKPEIWSELKKFLLDKVFHGKCAYCESYIKGSSFGDAEHYRPKSLVTVKIDGKAEPVMCGSTPHPGYYWLAYDWRNILPACELCNSADGKMNQFPIDGEYVTEPGKNTDTASLNATEHPLLLHPYFDKQIGRHITFGDAGEVFPSNGDKRGDASIRVYNLARESLTIERAQLQKDTYDMFVAQVSVAHRPVREVLEDVIIGKKPHSAAILEYVRRNYKRDVSGNVKELESLRY